MGGNCATMRVAAACTSMDDAKMLQSFAQHFEVDTSETASFSKVVSKTAAS